METAFVTPKSRKAKNRFANLMDNDEMCFIEQLKQTEVFLTSRNGKNHFWVSLKGDKDWEIDF
jgi:hypothetical protein